MATVETNQGIQSIVWEAVITRADGSVEDLGVVSYWNKSPLKRLKHKVSAWLR